MVSRKMPIIFYFILLVVYEINAVINKVSIQPHLTYDIKNNDSVIAENRISNRYGLPLNAEYKELSPVYGPPELTGDHRPLKIYDPPPPEQPPPQFHSPPLFSSYNSLNKVKQQYSLRKSTLKPLSLFSKLNYNIPQSQFGPGKSEYNLSKFQYNPSKPHYSPPKSIYESPISSLRPPKSEYGPSSKLESHYNLQSTIPGSTSLSQGPPIPLSIEAYGPPIKKPVIPFISTFQENSDVSTIVHTPPQQQYGTSTATDIYNPPSHQLSGIAVPPTPPDIKYDGWQPIAGHTSISDQQQSVTENYNPSFSSNFYRPSDKYGPPLSNGRQESEHISDKEHLVSVLSNSNIPSDSYGTPLHNPEDHSLKSSVSKSTTAHESNGLPPPALPQFEPLHNNQPAIDSSSSNNIDQHYLIDTDLSTNPGKMISNSYRNNGNFDSFYSNTNGQTSNIYESSFKGSSDSSENGLSLQQISDAPSENYDLSVLSNTYTMVSPSFSAEGLFSTSNNLRGSNFASFDLNFYKNNGYYQNRNNRDYKTPTPLPSGFVPPRRPPMKFRESIPSRLLTNLNRYISPIKPQKIHGPPLIQNQQLPSRQNIVPFHSKSNLFTPSNSVIKSHAFNIHTALAAPNVNYGIPLSFNDFNTPAPSLTYGAPNFGPASSLGTSNLYNSAQSTLAPVYGIPTLHVFDYDCDKNRNNLQYNLDNINNHLLKTSALNYQNSLNSYPENNFSGNLNTDYEKSSINSIFNSSNTSLTTPTLNDLQLREFKENGKTLKDSYGNLINNRESFDQSSTAGETYGNKDSNTVSDISSQKQNSFLENSVNIGSENKSAELLTTPFIVQGYDEVDKNKTRINDEATEFIKSDEGTQSLALTQTLSTNDDGFQIEGSKGTYTLQIQPADLGYDTNNFDRSIRHDQVLSNGLLQNILAVIEQQPKGEQIQLQSVSQSRNLKQTYGKDLINTTNSAISRIQLDNFESSNKSTDINLNILKKDRIALYFDQNYNNTNKDS